MPAARPPKLLLIVVAVLIVGGVAVAPWLQLGRLKDELRAKQQTIASLTGRNSELQQDVARVEGERKEIEGRLGTLKGQLVAAKEEVARLQELQARYDLLKDDHARLETQVEGLTRDRRDAERRVTELREEKEDLERAAARLQNRLTLIDRDYQRLAEDFAKLQEQQGAVAGTPAPGVPATTPASPGSFSPMLQGLKSQHAGSPQMTPPASSGQPPSLFTQSAPSLGSVSSMSQAALDLSSARAIELPPIVVRKNQAASGLPVRAQVVEVNEVHRFLVIDKGIDDRVRVGMTFDILRSGGFIGQAVAVRVRPRMSACDLITAHEPATPQVGDLAIQRGP